MAASLPAQPRSDCYAELLARATAAVRLEASLQKMALTKPQVDARVHRLVERSGAAVARLAQQLAAGELSAREFVAQTKALLAKTRRTARRWGRALEGRGSLRPSAAKAAAPDDEDEDDEEEDDELDSEHEEYLFAFGKDVQDGKLSPAQLGARAALWGGLAWTAYQFGRSDGATEKGRREADWELDPDADHCDDCLDLADGSPYPIDDLPAQPGDGSTVCGANCRCEWSFS